MSDEQDAEICERLIKATLTRQQIEVIDGRPVWELELPQREEFDDPAAYVSALSDYGDRVMAERKKK